jgi:3-methylcrotonyl-CoA carboxylase beta subunit
MRLLLRSPVVPRLLQRQPQRLTPLCARRSVSTHSDVQFETALSTIRSQIDTSSVDFKKKQEEMSTLVNKLQELHQKIALGGPEKAREKHIQRGKMLPRE